MNRFLFLSLLISGLTVSNAHATIPGFEDPNELAAIMNGQILFEDRIKTQDEFLQVGRAFYKKVQPNAFIALAVDHKRYPEFFPEVVSGQTLYASADQTVYQYKLDIIFQVGPFKQHGYPEGQQTILYGADAYAESMIDNEITNSRNYIQTATQTTRLIPYQGGILIEDVVHVLLQKNVSGGAVVGKKLKEYFRKYLEAFRKELE